MEEILNEIARLEEEIRRSQARERDYAASLNNPETEEMARNGIARERSERQGYLGNIETLRNAQNEIRNLESQLEASARRREEYRNAGSYDQQAMESSEYARITEEINKVKDRALGRGVDEKDKSNNPKVDYSQEIAKLEKELEACSSRMKEYKEAGVFEQEAYERSEYAKILEKLNEYKELQEQNIGNKNLPENKEPDKQNSPVEPFIVGKKTTRNAKATDDKITIIYNPVSHTYSINGEKGRTEMMQAEALNEKKKLKQKEKMAYIDSKIPKEFSDLIFAGISKKTLKTFDPDLLTILFNQYGGNKDAAYVARDYMLALEGKTKDKNKANLPYKMIYNLKDLDNAKYVDGTKMGLFDKARLKNMVAANKDVADVIAPERKKLPLWKRIALTAASGILAITSGLSIAALGENNAKQLPAPREPEKVGDIEQPGTTVGNPITGPQQEFPIIEDKKDKFIESIKYTPTEDLAEMVETIKAQEIEDIKLGTILQNLPEGLQFQEGMDGGRVGQIGNAASPKEGFYVIDRTIKIGEHSLDDYKYGLDGTQIEKDSSMVHISFVEGAKTMEEAKAIVEASKDARYSDEAKGIGQRGWIKTDTIRKLYEKQQSKYQIQDVEVEER